MGCQFHPDIEVGIQVGCAKCKKKKKKDWTLVSPNQPASQMMGQATPPAAASSSGPDWLLLGAVAVGVGTVAYFALK